MKSGQLPAQEPDGLFKTPLSQFIDMKYPLVRLADKIDWSHLEGVVEERFTDCGCPGVPDRFMIGMLILKATDNLSDEMLFERWPCNPYYQYFTGELYFQHRVVQKRSGMSHWRNRLGPPDVLNQLLQESLRVAHDSGTLRGSDLKTVNVDTTVQEKAIRYTTDASLLYAAIVRLGAEARDAGLKLRQLYVWVGKHALIKVSRYGHAKQYKRCNKEIRFLRTRLGRVMRDIQCQIEGNVVFEAIFVPSLSKGQIIHDQALNRKAPVKIDSWHADEVECIGKGKVRTSYEFGFKATITTSNGCGPGGMFVLHGDALHGNPYDGDTLGDILKETEELTGVTPQRVYVDKRYKGQKQNQSWFDPETHQDVRNPWKVYMSGRKGLKSHLEERSEATIGRRADNRPSER